MMSPMTISLPSQCAPLLVFLGLFDVFLRRPADLPVDQPDRWPFSMALGANLGNSSAFLIAWVLVWGFWENQ
jgi:hypothetical protein